MTYPENRLVPVDDPHFWSKVEVGGPNECWRWKGIGSFYGSYWDKASKTVVKAHRYAVQAPSDLMVCHKCDNPRCVNPDHLFLGSHQDNMADMVSKGRHMANRNPATGVSSPRAALTEAQVVELRNDVAGGCTYEDAANRFGISVGTVKAVARGNGYQDSGGPTVTRKVGAPTRSGVVLTESDVVAIRQRRAKGETATSLAAEFQVTRGTINHIVKRSTWSHVKETS